jgi:hypothetical protein
VLCYAPLLQELEALRRALAESSAQAAQLSGDKVQLQRAAEALRLGHAVGAGKPSRTEQQFFHNTCLLVKLLLSASSAVPNLPIDELYDEAVAQRVAMDEWPMFVYNRFCAAAEAEPVREFAKP